MARRRKDQMVKCAFCGRETDLEHCVPGLEEGVVMCLRCAETLAQGMMTQLPEYQQVMQYLAQMDEEAPATRSKKPLPSVNVFLRLKELGIGRVFVVVYNVRIVSGSTVLCCAIDDCWVFYEWYRASVDERIEGVYPSVVATWQALSLAAERGGRFDFMGAGPRDKTYGVRDFKLSFGGELTPEYRYRKLMLF
jgi:hypothetical protein